MRKPSGALWSHRDFLKLWTGQTISEFGSQVSQLAIPAAPCYSPRFRSPTPSVT
jgi:hypothetical protein